MLQWVRVPVIKPSDLSLIPKTHVGEEENQLPQSSNLKRHACTLTYNIKY